MLANDRIGPATHGVIKKLWGRNAIFRLWGLIAGNGPDLLVFYNEGIFAGSNEDLLDVGFPYVSPSGFL
jgi:hypothetical protein